METKTTNQSNYTICLETSVRNDNEKSGKEYINMI